LPPVASQLEGVRTTLLVKKPY